MRTGSQTMRAVFSLLSLLVLLTGCRGVSGRHSVAVDSDKGAASEAVVASSASPVTDPVQEIMSLPSVDTTEAVHSVSFVDAEMEEIPAPVTNGEGPELPTLDVEYVVAQVLAVNPDVRSASAAWRAAARRYPQEVALDDPMFGYLLGPGSWGSNDVEDAYMLDISQKVPWHGKRQLRGNIARAQANAAFHSVAEERLRIAEMARLAYYEYFLAHRQIEVLKESTQLLKDFREIAIKRYESASVEQQDVLLADVELAQLDRRSLELLRREQVARARINTLLLTVPDAKLSPPPRSLSNDQLILASEDLRGIAISQRPELAAQAARVRAERHALALACKDYYPDFEVVGRYDAFWQEDPLRPMVGMNLNLPIYKKKRDAALSEARARLAKEQADYDAKTVEIVFAVEQAYQQAKESRQTIAVYEGSILPSARHSVDAARASYLAARLDFLRLIESQRQLLSLQDEYFEAVAEYHIRLAELERVVGVSPVDTIAE